MPMPGPRRSAPRRNGLTRERVLGAAVEIADRDGLEALTMRRLGQELGVEAMSLYTHVANKDDILDGLVDLVVGRIEVPPAGTPWKAAMRHRAVSAHEELLAHPWAAMLVMSRFNIGPGMTRYLDATLGRLREGGFSVEGALDAWNILDSHLYGFTLQELSLPFEVEETRQVSAQVLGQLSATEFPHVVEVITQISRTGRDEDFELGLDLILDGLERRLEAAAAATSGRRTAAKRQGRGRPRGRSGR
jgi:AcrR family transcriptional regulator